MRVTRAALLLLVVGLAVYALVARRDSGGSAPSTRAILVEALLPDRTPVAGAVVTVRSVYDSLRAECRTSEGGSCRVELDPRAEVLWIEARTVRHVGVAEVYWPAFEGDRSVAVTLERESWELVSIGGTVVGPGGEPLPQVPVALGDPKLHQSIVRTDHTDAEGSFRFEEVPEGTYFITAEAADLAPATVRVKILEGTPPVRIELHSGATITGRLLGVASDAAQAQRVSAVEIESEDEGLVIRMRGYPPARAQGSLSEGSFRIDRVPPGLFSVFAWIDDARYDGVVRLEEGQPSATVDLIRTIDRKAAAERVRAAPRDLLFRGRVVDAESGEPLAGVEIVRGWRGTKIVSAEDGTFEFEPMASISGWEFHFTHPGYVDHRIEPSSDFSNDPLTVSMQRGSSLAVRLEWSDGLPLDWALLSLVDSSGEEVDEIEISNSVVWDQLPAGEFALRIQTEFGSLELPVRIPGDQVALDLPPMGAVNIRVLDLELDYGEGWLDGVTVEMRPLDSAVSATPVVAAERLRVKGLSPGHWGVDVTSRDGRRWHGSVEISVRRVSNLILR